MKSTAFYHQLPVKFECTQCGQCCRGKGSYVFLHQDEVEKIRRIVNVSAYLFKKKFLDTHPEGDLVLAQRGNGDCIFLLESSAMNRLNTTSHNRKMGCQIYKNRPVQCSSYPFWPEILTSKKTWLQEAEQCEGINRGNDVSSKTIERTLDLLRE